MAKKVKSFFTDENVEHGNSKYPWHHWSNGDIWEAVKGRDFDCMVTSFRGTLYNQAVSMGLRVKIRTRPKMGKVRFSFYNPSVVKPPTETPEETKPVRAVIPEECLTSFPPDLNTYTPLHVVFGEGLT